MPTFQVLIIAGYLNILFMILVLLTCRCIGFWRLTKGLMKYRWYQKLYSKHCYFWYGFFISVLIHTLTAFSLFGFGF